MMMNCIGPEEFLKKMGKTTANESILLDFNITES